MADRTNQVGQANRAWVLDYLTNLDALRRVVQAVEHGDDVPYLLQACRSFAVWDAWPERTATL